MSFNEIYGMLKSENVDKVCFVEAGAFFLTIGSDVECLEGILGFNRICFSEGICKAGFPNNSLAKYMKIMYDMGIPYVVYGYVLDEESGFKIEIEHNGKKYTKLVEMDGDIVIKKRIEKLYSTYKVDCNRCEYKKTKLIKEIKACEKRKFKLEFELQRIMLNEEREKTNINSNVDVVNSIDNNISLFSLLDNDKNNIE